MHADSVKIILHVVCRWGYVIYNPHTVPFFKVLSVGVLGLYLGRAEKI